MHSNEKDVDIDYRAIRNKLNRDKIERNARDESDSERRSHRSDREVIKNFDKDDLRRKSRHSPPLPSNRSRNSSLSNRSNQELDFSDHDLNKKKSGSRLSFADEIDFDKHASKGKHAPDSPLKNMLKSELTRARSTESLRHDNEKLKDHERDRSRGREKDQHERDSSRSKAF